MNFAALTYENFHAALKDRSEADIRSMLRVYKIDLPAYSDLNALIRAAHELLCAQSSGPAPAVPATAPTAPPPLVADPATSPDAKPAGTGQPGRKFRMRCKNGRRRRCDRSFTTVYEIVAESEFTAAEWVILRADPCIQIFDAIDKV